MVFVRGWCAMSRRLIARRRGSLDGVLVTTGAADPDSHDELASGVAIPVLGQSIEPAAAVGGVAESCEFQVVVENRPALFGSTPGYITAAAADVEFARIDGFQWRLGVARDLDLVPDVSLVSRVG